jgi:hypothetical protein
MNEPLTIIPEANHALRIDLAMFVQQPDKDLEARILAALSEGSVRLFVHVTRKVGGEDEPPITAADLSLAQLDNGIPIRLIYASTKLTLDNLSPTVLESGKYCRQISAKELHRLCRERGIMAIELDGGLMTGVMIGPFMEGRQLRIQQIP